jgi:hypothetical protein
MKWEYHISEKLILEAVVMYLEELFGHSPSDLLTYFRIYLSV